MLGRRLFASLLPTAPVAAATAAKDALPSTMANYGSLDVGESSISPHLDKSINEYYKQLNKVDDKRKYQRAFHYIQTHKEINLNIAALRSVSPVMKMHMETARQLKLDSERKSITDALRENFGLTGWFADQAETQRY
jgi:hypothetical protein